LSMGCSWDDMFCMKNGIRRKIATIEPAILAAHTFLLS
jgi:hypothetical protein